MHTVELFALPGEFVSITELENARGMVVTVNLGNTSLSYEVRYWHNGEAKTVWLTEKEMTK